MEENIFGDDVLLSIAYFENDLVFCDTIHYSCGAHTSDK